VSAGSGKSWKAGTLRIAVALARSAAAATARSAEPGATEPESSEVTGRR
jgi:hypothetical protein